MSEREIQSHPDELLYLADQQAYARNRYAEDDYGLIRESRVIEWALRQAASRLPFAGAQVMGDKQPKMIPNPLYCNRCEGRGYLVADAEWEPYAVQCDACKDRRPAPSVPSRDR
ncbi:MAG: hypothetical protein V4773_11950 [Verrucomicrobiota bacterium]